jgi:TRAP-type C4-dicarboxylate transport system substrate-binding protein
MRSLHDQFEPNRPDPGRRAGDAMKACGLPLATAAALTAGCGGSAKLDKTGTPVHDKPLVLTLADHETGMLDVQTWIQEVQRRAGGTIRIEVRQGWRAKDPDYDRGTIADVRAGRIDIAKIAARSWDEVGVQSFRALVAPMLVDSYALEQRVLTSDLPAQMLKGVNKQDLVGLAVLPGLLRKPLGISRVLRSPQDFANARIGIRPGEVARQTFAALGGTAVAYVPSDRAAVSRLDGAELDADVIASNAYDRNSRALTANVDLWPRALTLVMNKRSFDRLTARQRQALLSVPPAAVARTVAFAQLDAQDTQVLCQRGLKLVTATASDLRALHNALRPVYATLERDAQTKRAIAEIQSLKSGLGAAGAPSVSKCGASSTAGIGQSSPIDGTYHSTVTRAQLLSNPKIEPGEDNPGNYGQFTLTIRGGRFEWRGSADGIPEGGTASVRGDRVTLRPTFPADQTGQEFVYRWNRYRGVLSFTKVTLGPTFLVVHPWRQ